jgi:DNA-binding transcriptional LysR family regulator
MPRSVEHWDTRIGRRVRLRDLHVLLTVVQRGSMAKAAQKLAVSQPAVSKAVADLEHTLGVRLLDRSPHGIEPTLFGSVLVRRGLAVFDELRQGIGEIQFMADPAAGEVRVGCPESMAATLLPKVIVRLAEQYPGVVVQVAQLNPVTLEIQELRERKIDLMMGRVAVPFEEDDVNTEILFEEPLIVVAGVESQWTNRRKVKLAEVLDAKWILYPPGQAVTLLIEEAFRARGLAVPRASVLTFSFQLRDILLMRGDYLSIIPASMVSVLNAKRQTVRQLPIDLGIRTRPVAIFTLKNRTLSPVTELFVEAVRAVGQSMT